MKKLFNFYLLLFQIMKTEGNVIKNIRKKNIVPNKNYTTEFISSINTLSDSIKEYFIVTKNTIQNKNILIDSMEKELSMISSSDNNISEKFKENFNKLKVNINSDEKNLKFFFEDAKTIFKQMKDIHQNFVKMSMTKQRSYIGNSNSNRHNIYNINNSLEKPYQQSEVGLSIPKNYDDLMNNLNSNVNNEKINQKNMKKAKTMTKKKENNENIKIIDDNENMKKTNINNKYISEMEKLKSLNKLYEMNIKKLNITLKNYRAELEDIKSSKILNSDNNINNKNDSIIQEELTLNKDKVISLLREDLEKSSKKNSDLIHNFKLHQVEIKKLSEENKNLSNKLNNIIKENNKLKSNIVNSNNNNKTLKKEIDLMKKKINILGKQLNDEKNKNSKLMVDSNDKNKIIDNLKMSVNDRDRDYQEKQLLLESIKTFLAQEYIINNTNKSINDLDGNIIKLLENYFKENEQLKLIHKKIEESLLNLENNLKSNKNELNLNENLSSMIIKGTKEDNDKRIEEFDNINNDYLKILGENYNKLIDKIRQLNKEKTGRNLKIIKLEIENNELKENMEILNNIKDLNNILLNNSANDSTIKNQYNELNKKYEEQKQQNKELNEKILVIKNENDIFYQKLLNLGIKYVSGEETNIPQNQIIDELNKQINQLKTQNETLNDLVETYTSQLWDKMYNNKNEIVKKEEESEKAEDVKQKRHSLVDDKEKCNNEIKILKRENEKLTNQIIRLSTNLPKEFNALQKQYNELELKYKQSLKNKNNSNNNNINNNINNININNINNNGEIIKILDEIKKIKKENELIKKKNSALVSQLEEKEIKNNCFDTKSENANLSNYEEEFDLRAMAIGAKEKNRSQDINIDYPGIQNVKDKYRELNFYYKSMINLVKDLLLNIQVNAKNKTYVTELCKIVGFDPETTNNILNNKTKNKLFGLFKK